MHSDTFVIAPLLPILRVDEAIAGTSKARFSRGANPHTLIRRIEYPFARLPRFFSKNRTNLLKQWTVGRLGDPERVAFGAREVSPSAQQILECALNKVVGRRG